MLLERIIGNTVRASGALAVNPVTGDFAYPAGCVLVFYSPRRNRQTQFFSCENNRPLTTVAFSGDGKYVCAAESGRAPAVLVWDVSNGKLLAELKGHAFSVKCVGFSADGKMLASAGSQSDGRLHVWNWRAGMLLASARVKCEIRRLCFSGDGQVLMSAGSQGHLKFWELQAPSASGKCRVLKGKKAGMDGGPDTGGDCIDIAASKCSRSGRECYAITADGFLLSFDAERNLDKWVDVKARSAFSISVTDTHIACACAEGIVRLFKAPTLEYISTLPRPPPFRPAGVSAPAAKDRGAVEVAARSFPDSIAVTLTEDNQRAGCVYSDRSFFVWDLRDASKVCRCRAMHAHSGSIWDLDFLPSSAAQHAGLPADSFVTCGADSTIRVWGLAPPHDTGKMVLAEEGGKKLAPFKDLRAMTSCVDRDQGSAQAQTGGGVRCVKVSPDGSRVVSGDRIGNLRVHSLFNGMEMETFLEAHDAEILSVDFGGEKGNLLASAARDRLIHVFDVTHDYETVCTLDEHAAAVTSVRFAAKGTRLVSCGGDKRMIFRTLVPKNTGSQTSSSSLCVDASRTQSVPHSTVYDVCVDRAGRLALSAGQDNGLVVWDVASGSKKRRYTTESDCSLRVRLDPTGMFAATTSADKGIRLHDFHNGDLVSVAYGHSEPVTAVAFSPGLDRLVSASGDGCIFVWKLPVAVARSMKSRQSELLSSCDSVVSTPREYREHISGAGVFAASPSPQKPKHTKAPKPTISDLKKIGIENDESDARSKRDERSIASQRSMLSALLDETLDPSKAAHHASSDAASHPVPTAGEQQASSQKERDRSTSPLPVLKSGNWMCAQDAVEGLPPLKPAGGHPQVSKGRTVNQGTVDQGDLFVAAVDSCDEGDAGALVEGARVQSAAASTAASTVETADNTEIESDDRPGNEVDVEQNDEDKVLDFTVLRSVEVRMSRSGVLNVSGLQCNMRTGNVSGLGDTLETDDDDDADYGDASVEMDESTTRQILPAECLKAAAAETEGDESEFLREALSAQTVVVNPRVSLRMSRSVSHLLQQQIRDALNSHTQQVGPNPAGSDGSGGELTSTPAGAVKSGAVTSWPLVRVPCDGSLLGAAAAAGQADASHDMGPSNDMSPSIDMTPRGATLDATTDASMLSPGKRAGRNNLAQEKNEALAREIDVMRKRLQAMGMCGGSYGAQAPTPALSCVPSLSPSVQVSPAKPKPAQRTFNNTQRQREGRSPPAFSLNKTGVEATAAQTADDSVSVGNNGTSAAAIEAAPHASAPQSAPSNVITKQPEPEPRSLFDKMRTAGVVKAQQRAETGKASNGKVVYAALEQIEPSLAEERRRLKEEAARKVQQSSCVDKSEEQETGHKGIEEEKKRVLKIEADEIRLRLEELAGRRKSKAEDAANVAGAHAGSFVTARVDIKADGVANDAIEGSEIKSKASSAAPLTGKHIPSDRHGDESTLSEPLSVHDSSEPPSLPITDSSEMSARERENTNVNTVSNMNTSGSTVQKTTLKLSNDTKSHNESTGSRILDNTADADSVNNTTSVTQAEVVHRAEFGENNRSASVAEQEVSNRRADILKAIVEKAAAKQQEVLQARCKAEQVEQALREALQRFEASKSGGTGVGKETDAITSMRSSHRASNSGNEDASSIETVRHLEQELNAVRLAADAAEVRASAAQQLAASAQEQVQSLKAGELELVRRAQREAEARMTAEAAAIAALQQLHRIQGSVSGADALALWCGNGLRNEDNQGTDELSSVISRSLPSEGMQFEERHGRKDTATDEHQVRPSTAPAATYDLATGVVEFAHELGHTVVSPVVSSVKALPPSPGGASHTEGGEMCVCESVTAIDAFEAVQEQAVQKAGMDSMGQQQSQHVSGTSGPEVFEHPSGAGDMEDESMLLEESVRASNSSVITADASSADKASVPAPPPLQLPQLVHEQTAGYEEKMVPDVEAAEEEREERSLSCIQDQILPLDNTACAEIRRDDSGRDSDDAGTTSTGECAPGAVLPADTQTPHTSLADTVAHHSRPSTAPMHPQSHGSTDAPRPATPSVGRGWIGGRDGGSGVLATAELGHVTPLNPAMMVPQTHMIADMRAEAAVGHNSPSAGWQVAQLSLKPARQADPNHPLRAGAGMSTLDETGASISQSVYCSTLDDTQATGTTFGGVTAALPAVEAGERLRSSVNMALDLFNVARASGQRSAVADIVASLRASQDRISEALRAYDYDLMAAASQDAPFVHAHGGSRQGAEECDGTRQQRDLPVPAALPIHILKPMTQAPGDHAAATSESDAADTSPPTTTRHAAVPALPLPGSIPAAAHNHNRGKDYLGVMNGPGRAEADGSIAPVGGLYAGWSHGTPAASTALPSARSSMEYAGSNQNSHRCKFENLSEISIGSDGRSVDVEEVLERYSERLLQMVSAKLKNSSSASMTGGGGGIL